MTLPDSFDARRLGNPFVVRGQGFRCACGGSAQALPGTVVDDHDLGLDGVDESWRSRAVQGAVPARLPDADLTHSINGARQLHFFFPVEIRQIDESELAERE